MMKKSRTIGAFRNVVISILSELTAIVCGLVLPRLILSNFGSAYNGITQSITQFISIIALMKSGIGGATRAALYKPLSNNDYQSVSEIVACTEKFMRKVAMIFVAFIAIFACVYPFWINDFDWVFTSTLIVIISISTFVQYYFGFTYQMVLWADQKQYVTMLVEILSTVLNTIVSVVLINSNCTIHIVKLGTAVVNVITPFFLFFYVRKKYHIVKVENVSEDKVPQRWDAFAHEAATFVCKNTDVMVLTVLTSLLEVSVYTVYHYVISNLRKVVNTFVTGFGAAFGNMFAKEEYDLIKKNLGIYELIIYSLVSIIYSVTMVMIIPFVLIYTKGVNDVDYYRPLFAIAITIGGAFDCYRDPYKTLVTSAGHYKQTRNGAILEAVLNIVISVICTIKFGLIGVAIGTLCAMIFRTCQYAIYLSNKLINRSIFYFIKHVVISIGIIIGISYISKLYMPETLNLLQWIMYSVVTTSLALILTLATDYIFYKEDLKLLIQKVTSNFGRKKHDKKVELSLDECKKISLGILVDVAKFCDDHNITYFLACGTLLGAVRHKGYIPWDDDVDIMLPRPDYNRLLNEYKSDKYSLSKPEEGRFYYAKVYDNKTIKYEDNIDYKKFKPIGVDIDVFPLDGAINDEEVINKLYRKTCFLEMLLRLANQPIFYRKNPLKCINRLIPRIIGSKNLVKMIEKNAQAYKYETSDYVVRMRRSTRGFTGIIPKSIYEKDYLEFEGHKFCIPKGYDKWLSNFYGNNYMELPPEDKRKTVHDCKCYKIIEE